MILSQEHQPLARVDHLPQRGPATVDRPAVDEPIEVGVRDGADEILGRHVVLVDHDDDLAGVRHVEVV